jgi:hypothetical protein
MLPRLDDLVRLSDATGDDRNRVFNADPGNRCGHQQSNEVECFRLDVGLIGEPSGTTNGQMSAGRVRDHQIPPHAEHFADISAPVRAAGAFTGQKIA